MHLATLVALAVAVLWPTAGAHNWVNNPRARTKGLSKQTPCPSRAGNSISFVAVKGKAFGLEFSQGHPKSYTYFALVRARDEDKLHLASVTEMDEYIANAPAAAKSTSPGGFLSDNIFDKTAIEWSGGRGGDIVPLASERVMYEKRLGPGDRSFFRRPSDWRCSRDKNFNTAEKCNQAGVEVAQYKYIASGIEEDVRAAYHSEKNPWLLAVAKYKHNLKRAQEYDMAQMMFPDFAEPGNYVLLYKWGGYTNCFDVMFVDSDGGPAPTLVTKEAWIKTDHSQYELNWRYNFKNSKGYFCDVVPATGNVSACLAACDLRSKNCNAVNVVPYKNAPLVVFDEVNIPITSRCNSSLAKQAVSDTSLVCYGFREPDPPDVGTPNTISDDPRDAVFYSTSFRRELVHTIQSNPEPSSHSTSLSPGGPEQVSKQYPWHFGDQCLSCDDAKYHDGQFSSFVFLWTLQNECDMCE